MIAIAPQKPKKNLDANIEALSSDPVLAWFEDTFSCRYGVIHSPLPSGDNKPNWKTLPHKIRARVLGETWKDPFTLVGVRFDAQTRYGMIDIDVDSPYLNPESVRDILAALEDVGIVRSVIVRSSLYGGIHIYMPLPERVSTFRLAQVLQGVLAKAGFNVANGQLEISPNVKGWDCDYNAHRLPLQYGSRMVDRDLQDIPTTPQRFITCFESAASQQDADALTEAMGTYQQVKNYRDKSDRLSPRQQTWKEDLDTVISQGWTGHKQTNDLLGIIAQRHYVFDCLVGTALVDAMEATARACPGFYQWSKHVHDLRKRCTDWARDIEADPNYYPCNKKRTRGEKLPDAGPNNEEKEDSASERIKAAVKLVEASDDVPTKISEWADRIVAAGISRRTLYKKSHLKLWHPEKRIVACKQVNHSKGLSDSEDTGQNEGDRLKPLSDKSCLHQPTKKRRNLGDAGSVGSEDSEKSFIPPLIPVSQSSRTDTSTKQQDPKNQQPAPKTTQTKPIESTDPNSQIQRSPTSPTPKPQTNILPFPTAAPAPCDRPYVELLGSELEELGVLGYGRRHLWKIYEGDYSTQIWNKLKRYNESRSGCRSG